jgi:tRNA-2-methylthio-N6-dimethylallyladenosine synthase
MARHRNLCKHLHIPVQSGSDRILGEMKRGHTREDFLALIGEVRELLDEVSITTDLLAGFPGETAGEFEMTCSLMQEVRFDGAFMFRYSPRPGTYAFKKLTDDVPEEEKARRLTAMIDLQEKISAERYARWIGREVEVLVEGVSRRDRTCVRGKTDDFKTVVLPGGQGDIGAMRTVRIARASAHTLVADGVVEGAGEEPAAS